MDKTPRTPRPTLTFNALPEFVQRVADASRVNTRVTAYTSVMDASLEQMVADTGVALPLAAGILKLIRDCGASKIEVDVALSVVQSLAHLLPITLVAENVANCPPS